MKVMINIKVVYNTLVLIPGVDRLDKDLTIGQMQGL